MSTEHTPAANAQWIVRLPDGQAFGPATMDVVLRWAAEGRVPANATLAAADGSGETPVTAHEQLRPIVLAPPTRAGALPPHPPDDGAITTIIPFRNGPALLAYYLAVVSLIPGVGLLIGPIAFGLGIAGLRLRKREPHRKGGAHAWIGIIVGALVALAHVGVIVLIVVNA